MVHSRHDYIPPLLLSMPLVRNRVWILEANRPALDHLEVVPWPWPLKIAAAAVDLCWRVTLSVPGRILLLDASIIQDDLGCKNQRDEERTDTETTYLHVCMILLDSWPSIYSITVDCFFDRVKMTMVRKPRPRVASLFRSSPSLAVCALTSSSTLLPDDIIARSALIVYWDRMRKPKLSLGHTHPVCRYLYMNAFYCITGTLPRQSIVLLWSSPNNS
jgi:hypothetical protein